MKTWKWEAGIIAVGLLLAGYCVKLGMDGFSNRDRAVTVKGLAEKEVTADKVVWPISFTELGNDIPSIYEKIELNNKLIVDYLTENGIKADEINICAPNIEDVKADKYSANNLSYRYRASSKIVITSVRVNEVNALMNRQGELYKKGIAIEPFGYNNSPSYSFSGVNEVKPALIEEATKNARIAAEKFAKDSNSDLGKIKTANQGQVSIETPDENIPYQMKIRVVSTITYSLKD